MSLSVQLRVFATIYLFIIEIVHEVHTLYTFIRNSVQKTKRRKKEKILRK